MTHHGLTAAIATAAGSLLVAPPVAAQSSQTCQFALAGWVSTQLELQEARTAYSACRREHRSACTAEQAL